MNISLDYFIASLPYNNITHKFYGELSTWCTITYNIVPVITILMITGLLILWITKKYFHNPQQIKKFVIITTLSLAIGPGLIINVGLKDHWGRPRPYQMLRDNKTYQPFYKPSFNSPLDNSFPSGHAAIGFFLGMPLIILNRKLIGFIVSITAGSLIGMVRILQGGHYLSDVIFSGIIVTGVTLIIINISNKIYKV